MRYLYLATLLLLTPGADAAEVYRCTDPSGRINFTDKPCNEGDKPLVIEAPAIGTVVPDTREVDRRIAERQAELAAKRAAEAEQRARDEQQAIEEQRHQEVLDALNRQNNPTVPAGWWYPRPRPPHYRPMHYPSQWNPYQPHDQQPKPGKVTSGKVLATPGKAKGNVEDEQETDRPRR